MCGISGVFSKNGGESFRDIVVRMNNFQERRGPDDSGILVSGDVIFGHRRLSIIDLSKQGHQPMRRGNFFITFNGEIYNFLDLKKELKNEGVTFVSNSDTEVILALFEKEGVRAFSRFRGMFAFALFDEKENALYLVRDGFGIKPLYYAKVGNDFIFASTVRAIEKSGIAEFSEDEDTKILFPMFGSIPLPRTTCKGVFAVPEGCFLKIKNNEAKLTRYHSSLQFFLEKSDDSPEHISKIGEILKDSVSAHLVSDAPLGVFLSGGLDSSAIAALATKSRQSPIKTLSITFDEKKFSEGVYQKMVAEKIKSEHIDVRVRKEGFLHDLSDAMSAMDQPTVDGINTYAISKAAHDAGLKVVLSGLGADELFCGYRNFHRVQFIRMLSHFSGLKYFSILGGKYGKFSFMQSGSILGFYLLFRGIFTPHETANLVGVDESHVFKVLGNLERDLFSEDRETLKKMHPVQLFSYLEMKLYMQNQLLKDSDFMAMRHSVEIRVPFVDNVVVKHVAKISPKRKLQGQYNKQLLVKAVQDKIPSQVYKRKKMGFTFPFEIWIREEGKIKENRHWSKIWTQIVLKEYEKK